MGWAVTGTSGARSYSSPQESSPWSPVIHVAVAMVQMSGSSPVSLAAVLGHMSFRGDRLVAGTVPRMLVRLGLLEETSHVARGEVRLAVLVIF